MTGVRSTCCGVKGEAAGRLDPGRPEVAPSADPVRFRWRSLPGGSFRMGADKGGSYPMDGEGPARQVRVDGFAISAYAVTNAQFGDFVRESGYTTDAERLNWSFVFAGLVNEETRARVTRVPADTPWWLPVPRAYWAQPEGPASTILDRLDHPVVHVSWNDARAYCAWAAVDLPTEAEWECAARGGLEGSLYPWGDELQPDGGHRCNIWQGDFPRHNTGEDGYFGTAPVNAFAANGYGLHNMSGNVWEWCADMFSPSYHRDTPPENPLCQAGSGVRSLRGGSFLCHESYCNRYRVAARSSNTPDSAASNIGFRVVRRPSAVRSQ